ncbi:MAG: S8 family serine peptidase [bacterium]|nr:S8 family serine peptidase [bacterium]
MKILRPWRFLTLFLIAFLAVWNSSVNSTGLGSQAYLDRVAQWQDTLSSEEYVPGEVIIVFDDVRTLCSLAPETLHGLEITETFQHRPAAIFKIDSGRSVAEILAQLEGSTGIRSVYPNLIRHCAFTPNDPDFNRQEYMVPTDVVSAWDVTTGSVTINVAVIDTGIDVEHPEFAGKVIWKENLKDPDIIGADNVFDDSGHGTAVAGIIAAQGNNGIGIAGMAWDIRLMAFRACGGADLTCTIADEVQAIDSAVAHGADVINLSLGGEGTNGLEADAIANAYNSGTVIVAASGNADPGKYYQATGNPDIDNASLYFPAAFSQVIGVAALDNSGPSGFITDPAQLVRAGFSNYGEAVVSVAAVGTSVYTTTPYRPKSEVPFAIYSVRNYARLDGTSFACPQVSGLAALILSHDPSLSPLEVRSVIQSTALSLGSTDADQNGVDDYLGHGIINAGAALGNSGTQGGVFESAELLAGIIPSPIFADDIYVLVRCKVGCDSAPFVNYIVESTLENGIIAMEPLPAHPDSWLGRIHTSGTGTIIVKILAGNSVSTFPVLECEFTRAN